MGLNGGRRALLTRFSAFLWDAEVYGEGGRSCNGAMVVPWVILFKDALSVVL